MSDELPSDNGTDTSQDEMLKRAKQLLTLTDLVDIYPTVVERRVTGLIFLLVGGAMSFTTLVFTTLIGFFSDIGLELVSIVIFVIVSLGISFGISFKLIIPLTKSYAKPRPEDDELSRGTKILWGIFAIIIVIVSAYAFGIGQPNIFAIVVQIVLIVGNLNIYHEMKTNPTSKDYSFSHLIFVVLVILSLIPIVLLPASAFVVLILVDIGGLYALGIYILITAERILVQTIGRD